MIVNPHAIEKKSFEIIKSELTVSLDEKIAPTVMRVIHTTADFEYAKLLDITNDAIDRGIAALKRGCRIYADTSMICAGVNKRRLADLNCDIYTLVSDEQVVAEAKAEGITRSIAGMRRACRDADTKVFIIGNAPTALFTLKDEIAAGNINPDLVIGVPVGFVGAAESKAAIKDVPVPYIVSDGRKGGSTVAVAILNSLIYQC